VNSALQRARATLANSSDSVPEALSASQQLLLNRYVAAFERYDVDQLVALLREDATFSMPPYALWFQGPETARSSPFGLGMHANGELSY
jgi:RNA polymerase sigma-70 factor (ECF subfamily)